MTEIVSDAIPLAEYEAEVAPRVQTAVIMAVLWGIPMAALGMYLADGVPVTVTIAATAAGAALFGALWTISVARKFRDLTHRLYRADPELAPSPPAADYQLRVLCNRMLANNLGVGGHLYAGRTVWAFVPHVKNLAVHRASTVLQTPEIVRVSTEPLVKGRLLSLLRPGEVRLITVETGDGARHRFLMPRAEETAVRLDQTRMGAA